MEYRSHTLPLADPGMLQSLLCPDSLARVDCQHLVDQVLGLKRDSFDAIKDVENLCFGRTIGI